MLNTSFVPPYMGRIERIVRIVFGAMLIAIAVALPTSWGWLGIYPLITGLTGTMPVFKALRIGGHR